MANELKKPDNKPKKPNRIQAAEGSIKKKPFWKRVSETLFAETAKSVGTYLWKDVLLPAIKKLIDDGAANAIHMAIYGEQRKPMNLGQYGKSSVYTGQAIISRQPNFNRANRYQNIMSNCPPLSSDLALSILQEAQEWIQEYGTISVQTFCQILPEELAFPVAFTDQNWGWRELNDNCIVSVPNGYIISLPPAEPLK